MTRDFVIVVMLEPAKVGDMFTRWPLHLTLLPWFTISDADEALEEIKKIAQSSTAFTTRVVGNAYFGQRRLPVTLAQNTTQLQKLHEDLLSLVHKNNWPMVGRYTGPNFKPHVTQKAGKDAEGELSIETLWVAEALPQNYRKLVAKIDLGKRVR